ncbi:hypothetical protein OC834_004920 [Tilletia horrida]|nr:hypothetical protein OC834_004920 [Tilletia horrida]
MSGPGAFTPTTPLYARATASGSGFGGASSHQPAPAPGQASGGWGGFPSPSHHQQAGAAQASGGARSQLQQQQLPTTPGVARSSSGFFQPAQNNNNNNNNNAVVLQQPQYRQEAPSALALTSSTAPHPAAHGGQLQLRGPTASNFALSSTSTPSKALTSPAKMPAAPAPAAVVAGSSAAGQAFTRAMLLKRIKWNSAALVGFLAYGFVSVISAGVLDSAVESLGDYAVLLAKIIATINLMDAVFRLQTKAAEEKAVGMQTASAVPAGGKGTPAAKLALGVRSSPHTRPNPSLSTPTSSPSANRTSAETSPQRAPLFLQPSLRATLDEASFLATPPRSPSGADLRGQDSGSAQLGVSTAPGAGGGGGLSSLGASGRRWPSGSPAAALAASAGGENQRNISPVQVFRARRVASGRGRSTSGLHFDSSFDVGDDDDSPESREVEYGLKVLNSSFAADYAPLGGGSSVPFRT